LELGKHLVAELQLNDRGDWLRHWLAHHVAELIHDVEEAKDIKARNEAAKIATETILKIWDHRANLPGDANPLARYREALQVLLELRPNPDRWPTLDDLSARGVVRNLYRRFPKLMRALVLLPSVRAENRDRATSKAVRKFLEKDENRLLTTFEGRLRILDESGDGEATSEPTDDYREFEEAAHRLIDETIVDLRSFRVEGKSGRRAKRSRASKE
jgi:hypothetical protein